ncbi:MAG TPA: c-type cytochrome [Thermoanaerobaculia bacterium]|jgi:cytochrome c2|nr:c-type cytochrome [Thermoanaerobaculia bacterium]
MEREGLITASFALALLALCGCGGSVERQAAAMTGGEPGRGKVLVRKYGCESCHTIPGVSGADGTIGPPLDGIAKRSYLAGRLPNEPQNMIRWIRDPQAIEPGSAMPEMGITERDGRDIAAFLYTLR